MNVLHPFVLNYVKYTNMEDFRRQSQIICTMICLSIPHHLLCNLFSQLILHSNPELTNIHHLFQMTCTDKTGMVERDDGPTERVKSKKTRHNYS